MRPFVDLYRLEGRRTVNAQRQARCGIAEFDLAGMQHQALRPGSGCWRVVEVVAEDGMSYGLHVHPHPATSAQSQSVCDTERQPISVDLYCPGSLAINIETESIF